MPQHKHRWLPMAALAVVILPAWLITRGDPPTSQAAAADERYAAKMRLIDDVYNNAVSIAQESRIAKLHGLLDQAMAEKKVNAVVQLNARLQALGGDGATAARSRPTRDTRGDEIAAFRERLQGSTWEWGGGPIHFAPDGRVAKPDWTSRGLVTSWKAIDRNTVMLFIESGRNVDRYAILVFDTRGDSFRVYRFEGDGQAIGPLHRLK